ncbi:hypothetical protein SprV_0200648400 [Sparganum proliferum]
MDLMEAFDMVNREELWKIMQKFGCPKRFTHTVRQLCDGSWRASPATGSLRSSRSNQWGEACLITRFQSLHPHVPRMLLAAYRDERPEIQIAYRTSGQLLNTRQQRPLPTNSSLRTTVQSIPQQKQPYSGA